MREYDLTSKRSDFRVESSGHSLNHTTWAIYDILSAVGNSRETVENQTSTGDGGEIPLRAEVGSRLYEIPRIFPNARTAQG